MKNGKITFKIREMLDFTAFSFALGAASSCVTIDKPAGEMAVDGGLISHQRPFIWTQMGSDNDLLVKAIVGESSCPRVMVDGKERELLVRAEPSRDFPVRVCEGVLSDDVREVRMGDTQVPLPVQNPKKIVVLGDTGCRIKVAGKETMVQNCNDPEKWPFHQIARAAAAENPDLIIHLGDYHYRESPCPEGQEGCAGSPDGDTWPAWLKDFFEPAAPLFSKAPWILVRGNHESCNRAGQGWSRFFDPYPHAYSCTDRTQPYILVFGKRIFAIIDSSDDKNTQASLDRLPSTGDEHLWILTHRPFLTPPGPNDSVDSPVNLPIHLRGLGKISVVLAGHRHLMSLNQFRDNRPPELISGNGGSELDPTAAISDKIVSTGGVGFQGTGYLGFGYLTVEQQNENSWLLIEHDIKGRPLVRCKMIEGIAHKTVLNCDTEVFETRL